jgi:hypothetical protein
MTALNLAEAARPDSEPQPQLRFQAKSRAHLAAHDFLVTENRISEGGRLINGGIFGKTNVQTAFGKASQFID